MFGQKKHLEKALAGLLKAIKEMEVKVMSQISDYSDRVNAKLDSLATSVDGVVADVASLKKKIDDLQNSPGTITPEDQKLLDDIQSRVTSLADKVKTLDEATESPVEPPTP